MCFGFSLTQRRQALSTYLPRGRLHSNASRADTLVFSIFINAALVINASGVE
jgi:hypothetical protein